MMVFYQAVKPASHYPPCNSRLQSCILPVMRQIVLDTETTGLDPKDGHRIIEIGCVELVNRRLTDNRFHQYIQPERQIDPGAMEVHGITNEFLADKPRFEDIASDFIEYIRGAELIIHNAPFDTGFINAELKRLGKKWKQLEDICTVTDTLRLARKMHPGQKNTLDALCKRYEVDNSGRELHGALLDAELLADVYLTMTGGQTSLLLDGQTEVSSITGDTTNKKLSSGKRPPLRIISANTQELEAHVQRMIDIDKTSEGNCVWNRLEKA